MSENKANEKLRAMLVSFTPGSVLHLLAELLAEQAETARRNRDDRTAERCENVAATLFVVGVGIDAACPR